jgi:hypothetical protein
MQYYKIVEQTDYDNEGNYHNQNRFEVVMSNKFDAKKFYLYGYESVSKTGKTLEISFSDDMNEYIKFLTYEESKKHKKYTYHNDKDKFLKLYKIILKIYNIPEEEEDQSLFSTCIIS